MVNTVNGFEGGEGIASNKEGRKLLFFLGTMVLSFTIIHYYHQIKLARMKIDEMKQQLDTHIKNTE